MVKEKISIQVLVAVSTGTDPLKEAKIKKLTKLLKSGGFKQTEIEWDDEETGIDRHLISYEEK